MAWHRWVRNAKYPEVWTALYRLYDASETLLYVGIGADYLARWRIHSIEKSWWPDVVTRDVVWYESRLVAAYAEARAIRTEHPCHNVRPGIDPLGVVVFERRNRAGAWECPAAPKMVVSEQEQLEALRLVGSGSAHAAIAYEGELRKVYVPMDWYRRAREALGEPTDL